LEIAYGILQEPCTFCIHLAVEEPLLCGVPRKKVVREAIRRALYTITDEFDCDLLVIKKIGAFEDDTKGTLANFLAHSEVDTNDVGRRGGA